MGNRRSSLRGSEQTLNCSQETGCRCPSSVHVTSDQRLDLVEEDGCLVSETPVPKSGSRPPTCALCEVPKIEDVVELLVVVLFNVRGLFWCVLKLHGDLLQVFVQLEDNTPTKSLPPPPPAQPGELARKWAGPLHVGEQVQDAATLAQGEFG